MATSGMADPNKGMEPVVPYVSQVANRFPATNLLLSGPTTGSNGVATAPFTVSLPVGVSLLSDLTVTPSDAAGGGTFTPTTVRLSDYDRSKTFTYTLAGTGSKTISIANNQGLTNPSSIVCVIS